MRRLALFCLFCVACPADNPALPACGDGAVDPGEGCDDANQNAGDGCNAVCQLEVCGDGLINNGGTEACDDGANVDGDGCTAQCQEEFCGDGEVNNNGLEDCDDGANVDGDGCSADCLIEAVTGQLRTFVVDSILIPTNDTQAAAVGSDYNGDGIVDENDNSLADLQNAMLNLGFSLNVAVDNAITSGTLLYAFDVTADDLQNDATAQTLGYPASIVGGAAPLFNGADLITTLEQESLLQGGAITSGILRAGPSDFFFGIPLDINDTTILPMENTLLETGISATLLSGGKLTGTISAVDFAPVTVEIANQINIEIQIQAQTFGNGTAISCLDNTPCLNGGGFCTDQDGDATATGVCLDANATIAAALIGDTDKDGILEVEFDTATGTFRQNELAIFFNIASSGAAPSGLIGNLFRLDLDADGRKESIGIGASFTAVPATRQ